MITQLTPCPATCRFYLRGKGPEPSPSRTSVFRIIKSSPAAAEGDLRKSADNLRLTLNAGAAATLVEALKAATKEKVGVELVLHVKPKGEDGKQQVDDLVEVIKSSSGSVGVIQKVHLALLS